MVWYFQIRSEKGRSCLPDYPGEAIIKLAEVIDNSPKAIFSVKTVGANTIYGRIKQ
jgi:hypothetical protein